MSRFSLSAARAALAAVLCAGIPACGSDGPAGGNGVIAPESGDGQAGMVGTALQPLVVRLMGPGGQPAAGVTVTWSLPGGRGTVAPATGLTDGGGRAQAVVTLDTVAGVYVVEARAPGFTGSPVRFTVTALPGPPASLSRAAGDSQLGITAQAAQPFVVRVADRYGNPVPGVPVDWQVTAGGGSFGTARTTTGATGLASNTLRLGDSSGVQTATAAVAGLPPVPFTVTAYPPPRLLQSVPIPENYGIHDTFVRDGIAFVFAWNTGVIIYDVGNGAAGGTPAAPVRVGGVVTQGGQAHNGWWFWNPNTGERRYLFVGEEGPGTLGASSSGDIHVVDVSDLANPVEVASFHLPNAGTHNFWMDEAAEILYAAYYNGGVVALDVSGTLSGALETQGRLRAQARPGGAGSTYVWGVQLHNGSLYASDMLTGLWQLDPATLATRGGGRNVAERYTSDLWVANGHAYTGTWGNRAAVGNALKVWRLQPGGAPALVDSVITAGIGTVSDVEVSPNGKLLLASSERGPAAGIQFHRLDDPARPRFLTQVSVATGVHTATFGEIGGRLYVFAARNPAGAALLIYDVTGMAD